MQHYMYPDFGGLSEFGGSIYLLAIRKNIIYKLMWWLYKVRYDTVYFNDVMGIHSAMSPQVPFQV